MSWKLDLQKKMTTGSVDLLPDVHLTNTTINKRAQLPLDQYCTFHWDNLASYDNFGAFILNDEDSRGIQFHNGPSYSNSYTSPQFEGYTGTFTGVSFSQLSISFTIGVYWIDEHDYQKLLNWLHPYTIASLAFSFDKDWRYIAKLSKVSNGNRRIIGKEGVVEHDQKGRSDSYSKIGAEEGEIHDMYYTEIQLTFEVQGFPCLIGQRVNEVDEWVSASNEENIYKTVFKPDYCLSSNLKTPIDVKLHFNLVGSNFSSNNVGIIFSVEYEDPNIYLNAPLTSQDQEENTDELPHLHLEQELFSLYLQNLTWANVSSSFPANPADVSIGWNNARLQNSYGQKVTAETKYRSFKKDPSGLVVMNTDSEGDTNNPIYGLNIRYDSEAGLLFMQYGNSKEKLITTLNTISTGSRIVEAYEVKKFFIPGLFDQRTFDWSKLTFKIKITGLDGSENKSYIGKLFLTNTLRTTIECYSRTNVI